MTKKRIAIFCIVATILSLTFVFWKQTHEQNKVDMYVEWLTEKIEQLDDEPETIATVGTQTISENDVIIYSLLHTINVAYHENVDLEEIYTSERTLEEAFLTMIHDTVYSAYANDSDIQIQDGDANEFVDRQINTALHSKYANQKAIAIIENKYPSYFNILFRNLYTQDAINRLISDGIQDPEVVGQKALDLHVTLLQKYSVSVFSTAPTCIYDEAFIEFCSQEGIQIHRQ